MSAANVTNKTEHTPFAFPFGEQVAPGGTIRINKWDVVSEHHVVKAWLSAGAISFEEVDGGDEQGDDTPPPVETLAPADDKGGSDDKDAPVVNPFAKAKK